VLAVVVSYIIMFPSVKGLAKSDGCHNVDCVFKSEGGCVRTCIKHSAKGIGFLLYTYT